MIKKYSIVDLIDLPEQKLIICGQIVRINSNSEYLSITLDDNTFSIDCIINQHDYQFVQPKNIHHQKLGQYLKVMGQLKRKDYLGGDYNKIKIYKFYEIASMNEEKLHIIECADKYDDNAVIVESNVIALDDRSISIQLFNFIFIKFLEESQVLKLFARFMHNIWMNKKSSREDVIAFLEEHKNELQMGKLSQLSIQNQSIWLFNKIQQNETRSRFIARVKDQLNALVQFKLIQEINKYQSVYKINLKESLEFLFILLKQIRTKRSAKITKLNKIMNRLYEGLNTINPLYLNHQTMKYIIREFSSNYLVFESGPHRISVDQNFMDLDEKGNKSFMNLIQNI